MDAYLLGLVEYAVEKQLITAEDRIFAVNSLLDALGESSLDEAAQPARLPLPELLEQLTQHAVDKGLCEDNQVARDLFDTRLMGVLTPFPHEVRARFRALYAQSPPPGDRLVLPLQPGYQLYPPRPHFPRPQVAVSKPLRRAGYHHQPVQAREGSPRHRRGAPGPAIGLPQVPAVL